MVGLGHRCEARRAQWAMRRDWKPAMSTPQGGSCSVSSWSMATGLCWSHCHLPSWALSRCPLCPQHPH